MPSLLAARHPPRSPRQLHVAPPRVLLQPGDVYLTDGSESVRLRDGQPLTVEWTAGGTSYTTARSATSREPVVVEIVEANARFLRVTSAAWEAVEDIPLEVRKHGGVRVTAGSHGYRHPVVMIATESITAIGIHRPKPRREQVVRRTLLAGIGAGGSAVMVVLAHGAEGERIDGNKALLATCAGGIVGAIAYPVWRWIRPGYREAPQLYPVGEDGYQLRIRSARGYRISTISRVMRVPSRTR